jgi:hypothetical protein
MPTAGSRQMDDEDVRDGQTKRLTWAGRTSVEPTYRRGNSIIPPTSRVSSNVASFWNPVLAVLGSCRASGAVRCDRLAHLLPDAEAGRERPGRSAVRN